MASNEELTTLKEMLYTKRSTLFGIHPQSCLILVFGLIIAFTLDNHYFDSLIAKFVCRFPISNTYRLANIDFSTSLAELGLFVVSSASLILVFISESVIRKGRVQFGLFSFLVFVVILSVGLLLLGKLFRLFASI